jgi:glycosyltransferase involved in cell wall biosynthesis
LQEERACLPTTWDTRREFDLPQISVIVPVHNGAAVLGRCLDAIRQTQGVSWECIVVDDGSTDDSAAVARGRGAQVVSAGHPPCGPGLARNLGAEAAAAPLLCFVDADVVIRPDTLARFVAVLDTDRSITAVFGSYDAEPEAPGLLSQYRNLLHHFVHQTSHPEASTFWAGCGAIRRDVFLRLGGFDPAYTRPSIEDIELGSRIRASGGRVRLDRDVQVTHLKRWTFWGIVRTDIRDRALPWAELIRRTGELPNDLNLSHSSRASAISIFALGGLLVLGLFHPGALLLAILPLGVVLSCNRRLYQFFLRERGFLFLIRALPMHWLYYAYSALAFGTRVLPDATRRILGMRTDVPPVRLVP